MVMILISMAIMFPHRQEWSAGEKWPVKGLNLAVKERYYEENGCQNLYGFDLSVFFMHLYNRAGSFFFVHKTKSGDSGLALRWIGMLNCSRIA